MTSFDNSYVDFCALIVRRSKIEYVSKGFSEKFGYLPEDIFHVNIKHFIRNMLMSGSNLETGLDFDRCFVFAKDSSPKEVVISKSEHGRFQEYHFKEVPNSSISEKLPPIGILLRDDQIGVGVWSAIDFQLLDCNEKYVRCFPENKRANMKGRLIGELIEDFEGSVSCSIWMEIKTKNQSTYLHESERENAGWRGHFFDNYLIPFEENGRTKYIISILEDVTDHVSNRSLTISQKEMLLQKEHELYSREKILRESLQQTLEMKDRFLSMISHEFKTPLAVIQLALQTIEITCGAEITKKLRGYLNNIRINTYRQLRLVNNLLDIARSSADSIKIKKQNIDIALLTDSIINSVRLFAEQKNISLEYTYENPIVIGTDEEKYERVLLNLLSNSIKFSDRDKTVNVTVLEGADKVQIKVQDDGMGIPQDKLEIIFDMFGQVDSSLSRQAEGTGIGLYLAKTFVEKLGGEIKVESEVGKGSTFSVFLPLECIDGGESDEASKDLLPRDSRIEQSVSVEFSHMLL